MKKILLIGLTILLMGCETGDCHRIIYNEMGTCTRMLQEDNITNNLVSSLSKDITGTIQCCWKEILYDEQAGYRTQERCYGYLDLRDKIIWFEYNTTSTQDECSKWYGDYKKWTSHKK